MVVDTLPYGVLHDQVDKQPSSTSHSPILLIRLEPMVIQLGLYVRLSRSTENGRDLMSFCTLTFDI